MPGGIVSARRAGEAVAHLPHPGVDGTLCGRPPTKLRPCEHCLARRASLVRVHVQSLRRRGEAFCGLELLPGEGVAKSPKSKLGDIAPMYLSYEQAKPLLAVPGCGLEFCPGCRGNVERYDEANRRRVDRILGGVANVSKDWAGPTRDAVTRKAKVSSSSDADSDEDPY